MGSQVSKPVLVATLAFVVSTMLGCLVHAGAAETESKRPMNVLWLVTDDQRPDAIAALGHPVLQTPNLDRLVQTGFTFRNAYCMGSTVGAVCLPSRHMLHSGRSLFRYDPKNPEGVFGQTMRRAGYETYHLSKRGNTPHKYHRTFEHSGYLEDMKERNSGHHGRTAVDRTLTFLKDGWDRQRPFCIYLGFAGPHDPRVAAEEWLSRYDRAKIPLPANYRPFHPFNNGELLVRDEKLAPWPRTEADVRAHLHDYYACITSIDHHLGRLFAELQAMGEYDNTLIVFTSDHGLAVGSHGLFGKQSLYEHSMRAPLVFAGPGVPAGQSDSLLYLFDIYPTIAELAGVPVPAGVEGISHAPVIRGNRPEIRQSIFLAYRDVQRAVRVGNWKLIRYPQVNVTQLFDLRNDPEEQNDLAAVPGQQERVAEMLARLAAEQQVWGDKAPLTVAQPAPADVTLDFFKPRPR